MKKYLEYYMALPYRIETLRDPDGEGWVAWMPELPGCITTGDDEADALDSLKDAQAAWLSVALEHGDPIPEPAGR